jgi:hypothetical protein
MPIKSAEEKPKKVVKKTAAKPKKPAKSVDSAKQVRGARKSSTATKAPATILIKATRVIDPTEYFWLVNGGGLESLEALVTALEQMSEEQFAYHTQRDGNDFARWIGGVFLEEELARAIVRQKTREKTAQVLREYLAK